MERRASGGGGERGTLSVSVEWWSASGSLSLAWTVAASDRDFFLRNKKADDLGALVALLLLRRRNFLVIMMADGEEILRSPHDSCSLFARGWLLVLIH